MHALLPIHAEPPQEADNVTSDTCSRSRLTSLAIAAFIIGVLLRFWHAFQVGLWRDELFTLGVVSAPTLHESWMMIVGDRHPQLYYLYAYIVYHGLGDGDFVLRSSSILFFACLSFYSLFRFRNHIQIHKITVLAFILIAANWAHICFSSEFRMYSLLAMLTLITTAELMNSLNENKKPSVCIIAILGLCSIYTHYVGALMFMSACGAFIILTKNRKSNIKTLIITALIVSAGFAPFILFSMKHLAKGMPYKYELHHMITMSEFGFNNYLLFSLFILLSLAAIYYHRSTAKHQLRVFLLPICAVSILASIAADYYLVRGQSIIVFNTYLTIIILLNLSAGWVLSLFKYRSISICVPLLALLSIPMYVEFTNDLGHIGYNKRSYREIVSPAFAAMQASPDWRPILCSAAATREYERYVEPLARGMSQRRIVRFPELHTLRYVKETIIKQISSSDAIVLTRSKPGIRIIQQELYREHNAESLELGPGVVVFYQMKEMK